MQKTVLKVEGMSCGHCVNTIETTLKNLGANGKVDLANKTVIVEFDENKVSLDAVKAAIEDQGYDVV